MSMFQAITVSLVPQELVAVLVMTRLELVSLIPVVSSTQIFLIYPPAMLCQIRSAKLPYALPISMFLSTAALHAPLDTVALEVIAHRELVSSHEAS